MDKKKLTIVAIDDDPGDIEILQRQLDGIPEWNIKLEVFTHTMDKQMQFAFHGADIVFVDYMLGAETGLDVLKVIQASEAQTPVIMLTGQGSEKVAVEAMKADAADYLIKEDLSPATLRRAITNALEKMAMKLQIEKQRKELQQMAITDGLTGLYNRRHFMKCLMHEFRQATRYTLPMCILMLDLDFFKEVNDIHGHQMGDSVLRRVAKIIQNVIRTTDIAGRYGGEEFCVVLTNTWVEGGRFLADRIRENISAEKFSPVTGEPFGITCSIGMAMLDDHVADPMQLLDAADQGLYDAKAKGRNRLVLSM